MTSGPIFFSKFVVTKQVFYKSKHTYALVNLKPLVSGHVLVVPLRKECISLSDLTPEENRDYFATLQLIRQFIVQEYKADSVNVAIQDGPEAGQTVPHLHTHIIPRYKLNNIGDKIYEILDSWTFEQQLTNWNGRRENYKIAGGRDARKEFAKPDSDRKPRNMNDMNTEAQQLSEKLKIFLDQNPRFKEYY